MRIRFFKVSWLDCEQYGKNPYKKKERNQQFSVQSVITFILFKCHRYTVNSIDFSFDLVAKRLMATKNLVVKNQNLVINHKSRPVKLNPAMLGQTEGWTEG